MKRWLRNSIALAAVFGSAVAGGVVAQQPTVLGLVSGGPTIGYPLLRTQPGTAAIPAESSGIDVSTGYWFPAVGVTAVSAAGVEAERYTTAGPLRSNGSVGALSTAGAGTITAAIMASGLVNRTGPTAGFTDTTDTAAAIDTLFGTPPIGATFDFEYANGVAFAAVLAGGTNVTIVGSTGVVASGSRLVRCVKTAATPAYSCG